MTMNTSAEPPYYILYSHSPISSNVSGAPSTALGHPIIQYHYADDSPLSLLLQTADEHVLILDFDPMASTEPTVRSISRNIAVTGVKVPEAPGAAAEDELKRNDRMYILETTTTLEDKTTIDASPHSRQTPQAILTQFKQRIATLRCVLEYPNPVRRDPSSPSTA